MRISDWSSDVCSSDLVVAEAGADGGGGVAAEVERRREGDDVEGVGERLAVDLFGPVAAGVDRLEGERSAERSVGKECVSPCRTRLAPYNSKKDKTYSNKRVCIQTY